MINRFDSARKFAHNIVEAKNLTPPIDPTDIIKSYNIELVENENQHGVEAYADLNEAPKITINTEISLPARRKFTLAHELGHVIIPWHNGDIKCNTDTPYSRVRGITVLDTQELEANMFASELLMPRSWIQEQIGDFNCSFKEVIDKIRHSAKTSVMACLYALEGALPSGHLYYVKKEYADFWKKFASERTYTNEFLWHFEGRMNFLDEICEKKETFQISQYEVIYYKLLPCPNAQEINNIYNMSKDICECINMISDYEPIKASLFLDYLLNAIDDVFNCYVVKNDEIVDIVHHQNARFHKNNLTYQDLIYILSYNKQTYYTLEDKGYKLIFVKEEKLSLPSVNITDPNKLLKDIVSDIYPENSEKMRQRINGIVASINSRFKGCDVETMYNIAKYRFAGAIDMLNFYNHPQFEAYVVNKLKMMHQANLIRNIFMNDI